VLSSHIKQVLNKLIHREAKKNLHLLTQNKKDAHIHMRLRKTQKEGMRGIPKIEAKATTREKRPKR
jgi:hypothetical protein